MDKFRDLKVGDFVIVIDRFGEHLQQVDRVTKTMIITKNQRFNIQTGYLCNRDAWSIIRIRIPSIDEIEIIIYKDKVRKTKSLIASKLYNCSDLEKLEKIKSILGESDESVCDKE